VKYLILGVVVAAAIGVIVGGALLAGVGGAGVAAIVVLMIFMAVLSGPQRH